MRVGCRLLAVAPLALVSAMWAAPTRPVQSVTADGQNQQEQPPQQAEPSQPSGQNQQPHPPPTLQRPGDEGQPMPGEPGPMRGPHAANTANAQRLLRVKTVFIEDMDNKLNESLAASMADKEPFQVVSERRQADALLHGSCLDSTRKKIVDAEVYLTGLHGEPIWMDIVRHPYKPPSLAQAVAASAAAIVEDLKESIQEARH